MNLKQLPHSLSFIYSQSKFNLVVLERGDTFLQKGDILYFLPNLLPIQTFQLDFFLSAAILFHLKLMSSVGCDFSLVDVLFCHHSLVL